MILDYFYSIADLVSARNTGLTLVGYGVLSVFFSDSRPSACGEVVKAPEPESHDTDSIPGVDA